MGNEPGEVNNTRHLIALESLDFLSGGGEMGTYIRSKDWSNTPLGSTDTWPQSLRTTVSLCIASNFPIAIVWGPDRVQIYNDGYWPITGDMHPTSMGQDFKECWHSAWPVIGQAFEEASLGKASFLENQRIFLDRYGYKEETFFTFSFSPILDESGDVGGLFHPVIELTQQTLAERRLNILSTLANHTVKARTVDEASILIMDCLKDFELDLPFVLLYSVAADGKETFLNGCVGVEKNSPLAPAITKLEEQVLKGWPFSEVNQNGKVVQVEKLAEIFGTFNCGSYPEPPALALVFPVSIPSAAHKKYFLVAGVSSRRKLDEKYMLFYELLAESVTNVLTKASAYEEERRKAEALAEIDKAKTVFFSNISHEFRTPLTLMLSPLEELLHQKENNFSETAKGYIETTHRNAIRLHKLVNTLLDFSRIESGREQAIFSLVDIASITKNLASNFRSIIEKAGLKLIVKTDAIIQPVYVDKQMWEKIVFNLLSNAFKYTLEGKITVELLAEKAAAVLKVTDTGVGIPENELPKMFERFHRVQNVAGRTYEGTGIGLSLIKELVLMHHGTIHVESQLDQGSVFTVKIPLGKEHLDGKLISKTVIDPDKISSNIYIEEIETLLEAEKQETLKSSAVKEKNTLPTILVVDDNGDMREHISSILSNNFNVITASNGMDALHKMKETVPALVLSDIMMPVMDGMGLLKEIKSNKSTENIPVIFLTARAGEESKIEGWETGADDYLVKPFSSKELVSRIASQIKTQQIRAGSETMLKNIFMQAPVAISVIEVPGYNYLLINSEAQKLFSRNAEQVLGKSVKMLFPEAETQGLVEVLDQVSGTGVTFAASEMPLMLDDLNDGVLRQRYLNFSVEAIKNAGGKVHSLLIVCVDITQQVESRKKIEESEKQQAYLLKLSDALRPLGNPVDIEEAVTTIAIEFMAADRCYYSTIEGDNVIILRDAVRGNLPSVAGVHSIGNFALYKAVLHAGRPFVVDDVPTSNILDEDLKQVCLQYQYGSFINVPVIKNGKAVGLFSLVESKPRKWTDVELQLTVETAERTWAAVERAKAEEALRKSEEQLAFDLSDAKKLQAFSTQLIHEDNVDLLYEQLLNAAIALMHADMASIQVYHPEKKQLQLLTNKGFHPASAAHWEWVSTDSKSACSAALNRGERCIISDVEKDEQTAAIANLHYYQLSGIRAFQSTPLISRNGILLGMISTFWRETHQPAERDLQLFDVLARQAADLIERKKSVEKIKESESRFRTMADASPVLIWTLEANGLSSYYNKTFLDFIGVSKDEDILDWVQIVHPDDIQSTLDTINTAIAERRSYSLECRLLRADGLYRWVLVQGNPRMDANDAFLGFVGSSVDITERKEAEEKVKESESRFRNLVRDATASIIVLTGAEMKVEVVNEAYGRLINVKPDALLGKPLFSVIPNSKEYYHPILDSVRQTGKMHQLHDSPYSVTVNGKQMEGFLHAVYQPYRKADGTILGVMAILQDVTEAVIARKKIEESEKKFEAAILAVEGIIWTNNANGEMTGEQPGWTKLTGQGFEEYQGYGWTKTVHPEDVQPTVAAWKNAVEKRITFEFEHRLKTMQDGWRIFSVKAVPAFDENGDILQWVGVHTDITEQREAGQRIKESEERFRSLAQTLPQLVWVTDAQGNSEFSSLRWKEYSGIDPGGENAWKAIVHPDDYDTINTAWLHRLTTGETYNSDVRLKNKNGEYRWHTVIGKSVTDNENKIVKWVGAFTDTHSEKIFTQELEQKVKMRTHELEQFNIELERKNKELESFTYISSHDLQEPLRKIQIFATRILAKEYDVLSDIGKDNFKRMQDAANRMQTLIQDLLAFSRTETSERKFEHTDLNQIIEEVREDLSEEFKNKHATLDATELCNAIIIPFQFRQLMYNLIGNALKFSVPNTPPHIMIKSEIAYGINFHNKKLHPHHKYCHISVSDNGIGFDQQYSEKIFEVFQRLHGRKEYNGTGIGLSIVKKIVENHQGIITAKSELKKGSTFDIFIPVERKE